MSKRNPLLRFFGALWAGIDGIRKILHLVLLLFVFLLFFGLTSDEPVVLPTGAALTIKPYGFLVEQLEGDPYDRAIAELLGDGRPQTRVQDIVDALAFAKDDARIEVVYLDLGSVLGAGLSKLETIAAAIDDFQESGKKVIANADFMGQQAYYLAAHADEIYLHPHGAIMFRGYGRFGSYYKDAIDLLRVDWNVFRVGTHKSFIEPYTRNDMSDEDRAASQRLVDGLWQMYREGVVAARGMDAGAIDHFSINLLDYVSRANGDIAIAALDFGLVDELISRTDMQQRMIAYVGEDEDHPGRFKSTDMHAYLDQMRFLSTGTAQEDNVAIVIASGDILFGEQSPGNIGADSTARLLRRARNDETVRAVVLRVDSPGGSVFAAEVIADEVQALREAGKPVVASMSSVAASGGYSISMNADKVYAAPATITGSIGVFGMFPTYQRTLETVGVRSDGVGTTPWSGQFNPERELNDHTKQLLQLFVEDTYDDFISDVALSRGMDKSDVDMIGQGQVWTGVEALENGLVDELGSLNDAINAAGMLAGLEQGAFGTVTIETKLSVSEEMILGFLSVAARTGVDLSRWVRTPDFVSRISRRIDETTNGLLRFNDPKGMYAHCLCELR
ncbi:MAG: signal peptide peptidase SppA [Woeseiaceae bacterium]